MDLCKKRQYFQLTASNAGKRILSDARIKDGIGDLVADLICKSKEDFIRRISSINLHRLKS